eukprot:756946-Hanusia_phi.AAC.2
MVLAGGWTNVQLTRRSGRGGGLIRHAYIASDGMGRSQTEQGKARGERREENEKGKGAERRGG